MSPNFKDLLHEFSDHAVEFLLVGAHALAAHGHTRATKDIDLWVRPTDTNARQVITQLSREHLIQDKRASGRLQDLADIERLEQG